MAWTDQLVELERQIEELANVVRRARAVAFCDVSRRIVEDAEGLIEQMAAVIYVAPPPWKPFPRPRTQEPRSRRQRA